MKKRIIAIFTILALLAPMTVNSNAGDLSLSAKSAVTMIADTKEIIYEKNSLERLPMASTTKIMTALVVLENCSLDREFKVADAAVGTEGTSAYLQKGDTMTVEAALYALLLQSANDVAVALALETSGSIENFSELMNEKAAELLLSDTQFKNPSGLPEEGHYTTARDLAYLAAVCLENKDFSRIVSAKTATVQISGKDRSFVNHNKLLSVYDGAVGVKTGFTKESGRCLVGAAERDGVRLVTVTLSASSDWNDHKAMFDYGFEKYSSYTLYSDNEFIVELPVAGSNSFISAAPEGSKAIVLEKGKSISVKIEASPLICAPVNKGDTVATAVFYSDGRELCCTPLKSLTKVT